MASSEVRQPTAFQAFMSPDKYVPAPIVDDLEVVPDPDENWQSEVGSQGKSSVGGRGLLAGVTSKFGVAGDDLESMEAVAAAARIVAAAQAEKAEAAAKTETTAEKTSASPMVEDVIVPVAPDMSLTTFQAFMAMNDQQTMAELPAPADTRINEQDIIQDDRKFKGRGLLTGVESRFAVADGIDAVAAVHSAARAVAVAKIKNDRIAAMSRAEANAKEEAKPTTFDENTSEGSTISGVGDSEIADVASDTDQPTAFQAFMALSDTNHKPSIAEEAQENAEDADEIIEDAGRGLLAGVSTRFAVTDRANEIRAVARAAHAVASAQTRKAHNAVKATEMENAAQNASLKDKMSSRTKVLEALPESRTKKDDAFQAFLSMGDPELTSEISGETVDDVEKPDKPEGAFDLGRGYMSGLASRFSATQHLQSGMSQASAVSAAAKEIAGAAAAQQLVSKTHTSSKSAYGIACDEFPWFPLVKWSAEGAMMRPDAVLDITKLKSVVAKIALDREAFLKLCVDELPGFKLEGEFLDWAEALLQWSPELSAVRFKLVPGRMKEDVFWARYFPGVRRAVCNFAAGITSEESLEAHRKKLLEEHWHWHYKVMVETGGAQSQNIAKSRQ